jgi:tRNA pseudouridine55 synthase
MKPPAASGVLALDKPTGPTSHDIVARVRRELATREVGHAGTLDPMASGVLVVAVGEATKLVPWLTGARKRYLATVSLGTETDSLDAQGCVVRQADVPVPVLDALEDPVGSALLEAALESERSRTQQLPPSFSAVHVGGERAYAKARRGEVVDLALRPTEVHELIVRGTRRDPPAIDLELEVSKGYYVRSLARDLSVALGTAGHLTALRRTRSGDITLEDTIRLDASASPGLASRLMSVTEAARRALPVVRLSASGVGHARSGRAVPPADIESTTALPCDACAWFDSADALVAVGSIDAQGAGRVIRGFNC